MHYWNSKNCSNILLSRIYYYIFLTVKESGPELTTKLLLHDRFQSKKSIQWNVDRDGTYSKVRMTIAKIKKIKIITLVIRILEMNSREPHQKIYFFVWSPNKDTTKKTFICISIICMSIIIIIAIFIVSYLD